MSDDKKVVIQDQYLDRIIDLAKNAESMIKVSAAQAEMQNELGKTDEERNKTWKELLGSLAAIKTLGKTLEDVQKEIAERKITLASNAPARTNKEVRADIGQYVLGTIQASKYHFGGADDSYLKEVTERFEKADPLSSGTTSTGGAFVPTNLASQIYELMEDEGEVLGLTTTIPMESMSENIVDPGSVTVAWQSVLGSEGTTAVDQQPTTAERSLSADTLIATMGLTQQLLRTSNANVVQVYTDRFVRRMAREMEAQILQGSGTPFTGISDVSGAIQVQLDSGKTKPENVTFEDISNLIGNMGKEALRGAGWWVHPLEIAVLRNVRGDDGHPVFAPPGGEQPATIYGLPFRTSVDMIGPTGSAQVSKVFMELGNLSNVLHGVVTQLQFDVSTDVAFRQYMAVLRAVMVSAILVADPIAFGRLKTAAS